MWRLVMLLSFCGFFEIYEIALTAFLSPGLIREGIFHAGAKGFFGLADQASFAAATFAGFSSVRLCSRSWPTNMAGAPYDVFRCFGTPSARS